MSPNQYPQNSAGIARTGLAPGSTVKNVQFCVSCKEESDRGHKRMRQKLIKSTGTGNIQAPPTMTA